MLQILADAQAKGTPALHAVDPPQARAMNLRAKELFGSEGPVLETHELSIPGPGGAIAARLYRPGPGPLPVILYYHGGGWVIGDLESHDGLCRLLAAESGCALLSIDYRLAPEHPFP
ncbi:MAG: alpha/beta hydrolase fold domain-containing protein, partial [Gammaproteobacteria bacterium]|nr:alpha/beta hydrolase fold domain-containing protein [Gammaproteobacteria bacterium]